MIVRELIQRIQSLYSKGVQSDDSRLTSRHIYNKALTVRALLISQEANKKQKINQWNYQTLPCVTLIEAPIYECPCLPPAGCNIFKTKHKLPKPLTSLNDHLIQSVTSLDGEVMYSEVGVNEKKYRHANKYTADKPDFFISNEHLYITQKGGPKIITVTGLFQDPIEAENYPSYCCGENNNEKCCDDCESNLDKIFKIDNDMVDALVELSSKELIELFSKNIEDVTNDSKDSPIQLSK